MRFPDLLKQVLELQQRVAQLESLVNLAHKETDEIAGELCQVVEGSRRAKKS